MSHDFSSPIEKLALNSKISGFTVEKIEPVEEISGYAYIMRHDTTRARLMWLACADDNKAFAIAFKTPPANDTGVFHILEHSVLCGSDKFPVKEPFVNLLKTSMQTFLNALTFSDKTMYPVASTNEKDLENLMDVYLDAVLHPAIYRRKRIFEQEGWHLEVEKAEGTTPTLSYNGVVFNEMKGALSSPEEVLVCGINRALFEGTPYGYVSGGDPASIPNLTYDEFIDNHARHYQLSNSYSILYGDLDIEQKLAFLDKHFAGADNRNAGAPNTLEICEPRTCELMQIPMATTPDNACVGLAYVFATSEQRERVLAADVLMDALLGSNEAPLKRRVLESGLGRDVSGFLYDGLLQPMLIFVLKGDQEGVARQFADLVEQACADLVRDGLGADNLEASLAQAEFNLREGDWGYPDGVGLAIQAMSGWLYNDEDATTYLHYEEALAHMHAGLEHGYFETLLDEAICKCNHKCCVEVVPQEGENNAEQVAHLAKLAASMTEEELDAVAKEAGVLHEEQITPDTPEGLATLPQLHITDVGDIAPLPDTEKKDAFIPCYHHIIETRHIGYAYWYFDISKSVAFEELPYFSILCNLLGKLDTAKHGAFELDTLCESKLGNLSFFTEVYAPDNSVDVIYPRLVVGASALSSNMDWLSAIPAEIWSSTALTDKRRIKDILEQRRIAMEMTFMESGHAAALSRVSAQFSAPSQMSDELGGVHFYQFLRDLLANFDERFDELSTKLQDICARVFVKEACEMSFTGSAEDLERFWASAGDLYLGSADNNVSLVLPERCVKNEAFIVPSNVCYVGEGMSGLDLGVEQNGIWQVASRALSLDYLWNEVRVLGGAYGCGFRCTATPLLQFYSYRDPAVDPTLRRFDAASSWLSAWKPTDEELEGYIVSCVASMDAPVKPRQRGRSLDALRIVGRDPKRRERIRAEVLSCKAQDIQKLAEPLSELSSRRGICIFGGREQIEKSGLADLVVTELFAQDE